MILSILFSLLASILFLFIFWKRLKEDYIQDQIFSTGFYILAGIMLGAILAANFKPTWWFWSSLSGALLGLSMGVEKHKLRMFEAVEASIYGGIFLYASYFLFNFVSSREVFSISSFGVMIILVLVFELLNKHYKKFTWYKSGRVGFSGLIVSGLFFILRAVAATFFPNSASLIGRSDVILSGIFAFISFISVYNLSRNLN